MRNTWTIRSQNPQKQKLFSDTLGIDKITAQLLCNRAIDSVESAKKFLFPQEQDFFNPFLLKDIKIASERISDAISNNEKILIYSDYDVDGITGAALLYKVLKYANAKVDVYIPDRIKEGYGLNKESIEKIAKNKFSLVITVDCGTTAIEEAELARELGLCLIITDHHRPQSIRPQSFALINPLQDGCEYPFKYLAGVGLAYKLAEAVIQTAKIDYDITQHLDMVSIGTIADVVSLLDENRIFAKLGLEHLANTKNKGIKALIKNSRLNTTYFTSEHVSYIIAPRLNAAGRLNTALLSVKLLITENESEAQDLAGTLERENRNRQMLQEKILKQATEIANQNKKNSDDILVLAGENWHPGVIGIVASKIVEKFSKPALLISINGNTAKGSGRSMGGFDIFSAVSHCDSLLVEYGGHRGACGFSIHPSRINDFREKINKFYIEKSEKFIPAKKIQADMELKLSDLNGKVMNEINKISPFGQGNQKPIFISRNLKVKNKQKGIYRTKIWITDNDMTHEASFNENTFREADNLKIGDVVDLAYSPMIKNWRGMEYINFDIEDIEVIN